MTRIHNSTVSNKYCIKFVLGTDSRVSRDFSPYKEDIEGSKPSKFRHRHRRLFVDRNEARSVFGQRPGQYHGFMIDKSLGGTFNTNTDKKIVVDDLSSYTKFKLFIKEMQPKINDEGKNINSGVENYKSQPRIETKFPETRNNLQSSNYSTNSLRRIISRPNQEINNSVSQDIRMSYNPKSRHTKSKLLEM